MKFTILDKIKMKMFVLIELLIVLYKVEIETMKIKAFK